MGIWNKYEKICKFYQFSIDYQVRHTRSSSCPQIAAIRLYTKCSMRDRKSSENVKANGNGTPYSQDEML